MLLSDPEMESSILISSDEGATYQKYRLTFYIQSLLFHPKQEDWVLAYSLDQKVSIHCFYSHLVTRYHLVKSSCLPSPNFGGYSVMFHHSRQAPLVHGNEFSFLLCSIKICRQVYVTYWRCCLSFHRLKMVSSIILVIWPEQPCEASRKCVFIAVL